jgi:hypothetical protein
MPKRLGQSRQSEGPGLKPASFIEHVRGAEAPR